jgi:outer membrane protein assembly factor BamB
LRWGDTSHPLQAIAKGGTIYVTSGDSIVALRDNKLKWRKSFGGKLYFTPSLGEDGTIYIGSDDNKVYALNPDGSLKWFFTAGGMAFVLRGGGEKW